MSLFARSQQEEKSICVAVPQVSCFYFFFSLLSRHFELHAVKKIIFIYVFLNCFTQLSVNTIYSIDFLFRCHVFPSEYFCWIIKKIFFVDQCGVFFLFFKENHWLHHLTFMILTNQKPGCQWNLMSGTINLLIRNANTRKSFWTCRRGAHSITKKVDMVFLGIGKCFFWLNLLWSHKHTKGFHNFLFHINPPFHLF